MKTVTILYIVLGVAVVLGAGALILNMPKGGGVEVGVNGGAVATAEFKTPITMRVGSEVALPDGLLVSVKEVTDSRCGAGKVCVWAGELGAVLGVSKGNVGNTVSEVRLGLTTAKSVDVKGYTFSLTSATEQNVTITVAPSSLIPVPVSASGVSGYIHIGPTCPVEKDPPDPQCADKPYANVTVIATNGAGKEYAGKTDDTGTFRIDLPVGAYVIRTSPVKIYPRCAPVNTKVTASAFTSVDIACDSGIR